MRKFFITLMEEATDGTVSTGMGGGDASTSTTASTNVSSSDSNGFMSEDDALSFLSEYGKEENSNNQTQTEQAQVNQEQQSGVEFNFDDIDMSMFGLENAVNQDAQQQVQPQQVDSNTLLMQQIVERIEALQNPQQHQQSTDDDIAPLKELAERMQQAGLLPKGLTEEHESLLQEVKSLRDEVKQQREAQHQQAEYQNKINSVDAFSKELEQVIPNYNPDFMISLVTQISSNDPRAGEQILNNPAMLITLWNKYGAKAQPKQQQTNVLSSSNRNNTSNSHDLFEKVKTGAATEDEELRLIASL